MKQLGYPLFYLCILFFPSNLAFTQSIETKDLSFKAAKTAIIEGQFEKALAEYNRIALYHKETNNWDAYLLTLDSLSYDLVITPLREDILPILLEGEKLIKECNLSEKLPEKTSGVFIRLGEWYYRDFNFDKASIYLHKALFILQKKNVNTYLARCYNHLALFNYYKGDFDKVVSYSDLQYTSAEKLGDIKLLTFAISIKLLALRQQRKYYPANQFLEKAFLSLQNLGAPSAALGDILAYQASNLFSLGKDFEGISKSKRALTHYPKTDLSRHFTGLTNEGFAYYKLGYINLASTSNSQALAMGKEYFGVNSPELVDNYSLSCKLEFHKKNFEKARIILNKAIEIRKTYEGRDRWYGILNEYFSFAELELSESNYEEANILADTLANFNLKNSISDLRNGYVNAIRGQLALATKKYKYAIKHFGNAGTYFEKAYYQDNQVEMLRLLGVTYLQIGDYQQALKTLQRALDILINNPTETELYNNPLLYDKVIDEFRYATILLDKATVLLELDTFPKSLALARETLLLADSLASSNLERFSGRMGVKKNLAELYQKIKLKLIEVNYKRYIKDKDDFYFEAAFRNSEKIKAINLHKDLHNNQLTKISKIPDSLKNKELDLEMHITLLEKELSHLDQNNGKKKIELEQEIFQTQKQYKSLLKIYQTNYTDYYQLMFQPNYLTIKEIKKELISPTQTILEFVEAENLIYVFVINKDDHKLISIEKDFSLKETIKGMQESLIKYDELSRQGKYITKYKYVDSLNCYTFELHQKIWLPIEQQVQLNEELVIIPHGRLNYIPFDILLKEMPKEKDNERGQFHTYKYLIDDYQISYNYSATLWHSMVARQNESVANDLLAFAPTFSENDDYNGIKLEPLLHNVKEVEAINQLISGDIFTGPTATEANFLQVASDYKIIHLSTHGILNDKLGDYSFLAFTTLPDSIENECLYNRDLYNLELNADMVVLSACNTATGELQKGIGIISLARGFAFAGAKSIISTLWSVNDESTKKIMTSFYKCLKSDISKNEALRKSKQDYRKRNRDKGHPIYWAAFTPSGDMSSLDLNKQTSLITQSTNYSVYFFGVLIVIITAVFHFMEIKMRIPFKKI